MTPFTCEIVSAEKAIFSGQITMIIAPGVEGELGIVAGHTPLLTRIRPGTLRVLNDSEEEQVFFVSGGYLEVQPGVVTVLADTAQRADDIDEAAAERAREEAEKMLENREGEFDYTLVATQLAEAVARLRTLEKIRKGR